MSRLTIFTPAYNRADLLPRLYDALKRQTNTFFEWIVVDDGSTDDTLALLEGWKTENIIPIRYYHKENGGIHTAYNVGIEKADTELWMCIDSDDFPPDDAVEKILQLWDQKGSEKYAGIVGLDYGMDGHPLKNLTLPDVEAVRIMDLTTTYQFRADTKMVHRTELLKAVAPMQVFVGEKNFNPIYLFLKIDQLYPLLVLNENLCFVDYQETGMANNIMKQYVNSPQSFAELRRMMMGLSHAPYSFVFRNAVHHVSSNLFARQNFLKDSPKKLTSILAFPFGVLLYFYIRKKQA